MLRVRTIVLNYNTATLTLALVNSLLLQKYNNLEIIVVDNNSNNNDKQLLSSSLPASVYFIQSNSNLGYSGGNNLGMKYNSGFLPDLFFILNSDLQIDDFFLIQKLVDGFNKYSFIPVVAQSPLVNTLSNSKPIGRQIQVRKLLSPFLMYLLSFSLFKWLTPFFTNSLIYQSQMPFENKYLICDSINGAAFIVSSDFMRINKYLDENVFLYFEEMILAKQIQNYGACCLLNGFVQIKHMQGASTGSSLKNYNPAMERIKYNSEAYFFNKYLDISPFFTNIFTFLKELELQLKLIFYSK
ncbi:glycosyltransferase family 2 protein [Sediminibacterium sp.]|uniref:glycosyltransferase family 2 protein n=1 Tax=Sediminibacterium sp. TaxID=1917865 RepID=UPI003F7089C7